VSSEQIGVSVGSDEGARDTDGSADGELDGFKDGTLDGFKDGSADGFKDGTLDGTSLGDGVGTDLEGLKDRTTVGMADGLLLSISDGSADGLSLSISDGSVDGTRDGATEGVVDGFFDGGTEGTSDGSTLTTSDGASEPKRQSTGIPGSLHFPQRLQVSYANIGSLLFFTSTPKCAQFSSVFFFKNGLQPFPSSPGTSLQKLLKLLHIGIVHTTSPDVPHARGHAVDANTPSTDNTQRTLGFK